MRSKFNASLCAVFLLTISSVLLIRQAYALDLEVPSVTKGDMVIFPGAFSELISDGVTYSEVNTPKRYMGWHIPGSQYPAGTGWWALVCDSYENQNDDKKNCKLHRTNLSVSKAKHGVYDAEPVDSQLLHWSPLPNDLDKVPREGEQRPKLIAVFKPTSGLESLKLNEGLVTTYVHQGMKQYPTTQRPSKLEVRLSLGNDRYADIIPRVQLTNQNGIATFELRIGKQRQQLPGYHIPQIEIEASGMPQLSRHGYLLWAGDLDGDGRPDLILNHGGEGINVALYLSTLAKEGELVGVAGNFEYFDPRSSGC